MKKMFEEEPGVLNEDDPAVKLELFETMKAMGTAPKDIVDAQEAREYEQWLKRKQ